MDLLLFIHMSRDLLSEFTKKLVRLWDSHHLLHCWSQGCILPVFSYKLLAK